ncbi:extracellular catalytic domain type 1 short-chain-length polyhydroxyalkanoate depolymerase [Fulvivirga sediminis]|uniref:RICIN domain-containing protein n=1 Tax=Fulvivirga sediminis TaxID=2803949 RepID=A0A937K184_9BACT|nr:RICIN domain-containing protein [Fulvivirga sediminis]MBL3657191.1 RICIN domain-containing protein [Fulvivirga sediminis]
MKNFRPLLLLIASWLLLVPDLLAQNYDYIQVGGTTRSMITYAPSGLGQNRPLMINMHGYNQDAPYQQAQAKWESIANSEKFVVVYPNGLNKAWDISGSRDIDFILAIIDNMSSRFGIDRNRVYLSGFSMGGMMTYHAANRIADKIAAFAPVSGYPIGGASANSSRPVPIIHTHGTSDDVVSYSGVQGTLNAWKTRNGCPNNGQVIDPYPSNKPNSVASKTTWGTCSENTKIVLITLEGKGHWWSMDTNTGVSTSQEIWDFVKNYSLDGNDGGGDGGDGSTNVWLEAECGEVGSLIQKQTGNSSSNNGYVSVAQGNNSLSSAPDANGRITYSFNVAESGAYTLWGRVTAPSPDDDSFWVQVDGGSWLNWNGIAPGSNSWTWDDVSSYNLSSGNHTLTIGYREDGALLDKLYITNTGQTPNGAGSGATNCGGSSPGLVNNGIYEIEFQTNSGKVLDLRNGQDANGGVLRPWDRNGESAQQWIAIDAGNGNWRFASRASASGRVIDLANGSTNTGTSIRLWENLTNSAQAWKVEAVGNGYYKITSSLNSSRSWDVGNCVMDGSAPLQLWDYYGTSCQLFKFNYISSSNAREASTLAEVPEDTHQLVMYPNPSKDGVLKLSFDYPETGQYNVTIFNSDGQKVMEKDIAGGKGEINTNLTKGIYILRVDGPDYSASQKLIVE